MFHHGVRGRRRVARVRRETRFFDRGGEQGLLQADRPRGALHPQQEDYPQGFEAGEHPAGRPESVQDRRLWPVRLRVIQGAHSHGRRHRGLLGPGGLQWALGRLRSLQDRLLVPRRDPLRPGAWQTAVSAPGSGHVREAGRRRGAAAQGRGVGKLPAPREGHADPQAREARPGQRHRARPVDDDESVCICGWSVRGQRGSGFVPLRLREPGGPPRVPQRKTFSCAEGEVEALSNTVADG
mmetsp:Transcript_7395/g.19949  ORF Transcript_7395/g.19949 Transcript_7395/m.19949 type:complete len:239 (-) Transcript_7395:196-912(-)